MEISPACVIPINLKVVQVLTECLIKRREILYSPNSLCALHLSGEYVIMVNDVTNPPFLGKRLPTAFMLVKIAQPKKYKKSKTPTKGSKASSRASNHPE